MARPYNKACLTLYTYVGMVTERALKQKKKWDIHPYTDTIANLIPWFIVVNNSLIKIPWLRWSKTNLTCNFLFNLKSIHQSVYKIWNQWLGMKHLIGPQNIHFQDGHQTHCGLSITPHCWWEGPRHYTCCDFSLWTTHINVLAFLLLQLRSEVTWPIGVGWVPGTNHNAPHWFLLGEWLPTLPASRGEILLKSFKNPRNSNVVLHAITYSN